MDSSPQLTQLASFSVGKYTYKYRSVSMCELTLESQRTRTKLIRIRKNVFHWKTANIPSIINEASLEKFRWWWERRFEYFLAFTRWPKRIVTPELLYDFMGSCILNSLVEEDPALYFFLTIAWVKLWIPQIISWIPSNSLCKTFNELGYNHKNRDYKILDNYLAKIRTILCRHSMCFNIQDWNGNKLRATLYPDIDCLQGTQCQDWIPL